MQAWIRMNDQWNWIDGSMDHLIKSVKERVNKPINQHIWRMAQCKSEAMNSWDYEALAQWSHGIRFNVPLDWLANECESINQWFEINASMKQSQGLNGSIDHESFKQRNNETESIIHAFFNTYKKSTNLQIDNTCQRKR